MPAGCALLLAWAFRSFSSAVGTSISLASRPPSVDADALPAATVLRLADARSSMRRDAVCPGGRLRRVRAIAG